MVFPLLKPHLFIKGLAGKNDMVGFVDDLVIHVVVGLDYFEPPPFDDAVEIAMEKFAVGLEVDASFRRQEGAVYLEEGGANHAVLSALVLDLWIGKGDPNLIDFAGGKAMFYPFNAGA